MTGVLLTTVLLAAAVPSGPVGPEAPRVTAAAFLGGAWDRQRVTIRGTVRDAFDDDVDPRYIYFVMLSDGLSVYAAARKEGLPADYLNWLIGAEIEVTGRCLPSLQWPRCYIGHNLQVDDNRTFRILRPADTDLFAVPPAEELANRRPDEMRLLGRHLAHGRVVAVWDRTAVLLKLGSHNFCYARLQQGPAPACGSVIDVSGFPSTDHYSLRLSHAVWRPSDSPGPKADAVAEVSAAELFRNPNNGPSQWHLSNGMPLRIRGLVRSVPTEEDGRLYIECAGHLIPVDRGTLGHPFAGLALGTEVEVTATAAIDTGDTNADSLFPRICGIFLILREAQDLRVLSTPSPFTPARLLALAGVLSVLLLVVFVWNAALRRLVTRRARALLAAQINAVKSALKTEERTRLAVELHDSVSQNLTGVSMEIEAAARCRETDPSELARHLLIADRALKSCRNELRNELWDLRTQALEEVELAGAVRTALQPHLKGVSLDVSFEVPRKIFTDNTVREILKMIRELALNGIRHGRARHLEVRGTLADGEVRIVVKDDGCGFEPASAPSVQDGHFGIQGVRERLRGFKGRLTIESAPGRGTTATAVLRLPEKKETSE